MPHEVSYDAASRILRVRYRGVVPLSERERAIGEACALAGEVHARRILLDFREAHSMEGDAEAAGRIAATWSSRFAGSRVAYLVINDHQVNDLIERLARERGVTMARFRDRDAALAWLAEPGADDGHGEAAAAGPGPAAPDHPPERVAVLVARALDPALQVPPPARAVLAKLARELLDAGVPEAEAAGVVRRMLPAILRATSEG